MKCGELQLTISYPSNCSEATLGNRAALFGSRKLENAAPDGRREVQKIQEMGESRRADPDLLREGGLGERWIGPKPAMRADRQLKPLSDCWQLR